MINITINYQGRKVPIKLNLTGAIKIDEIAAATAEQLTTNFSRYMKSIGTDLTEKSRQKYYITQYCLVKQKLTEKL